MAGYETTLRLGRGTSTLDAEGEVTERVPVPAGLTLEAVRAAAAAFVGTLSQQAPDVSAIKVAGRALHERVRAGETVEAPFRDVVCHALDVHALTPVPSDPEGAVDITLSLHTGKGYYVRSLGRDLALALGTVGHLVQLRRTQNGAFVTAGALDGAVLAGVHDDACKAATRAAVLPLSRAVASLGTLRVNAAAVAELRFGRALPLEALAPVTCWDEVPAGPVVAVLDQADQLVALVERRDDRLHVVRGNHDAYRGQTAYTGDHWVELPGVAVALLDTARPGHSTGWITDEQLDWLDDHPRWKRHFTPKHASWLNQIECMFSILDRRVIARGSFDSKEELRDRLYDYMIWHNQTAQPFNWSYRPKSWGTLNPGKTSGARN